MHEDDTEWKKTSDERAYIRERNTQMQENLNDLLSGKSRIVIEDADGRLFFVIRAEHC